MNWSQIQSPEMLEFSRKQLLTEEGRALYLKYLGIKENDIVVDVGCGTGCFTRYLADGLNGKAKFYGIEPDITYLNVAKEITKQKEINFIEGNAYRLPFADESIDVITDFTMMVYLEEPEKYVEECLRVLKKGGRITTCSFLTDYHPPERIKTILGEKRLKEILSVIQKILKNEVFPKVNQEGFDFKVYSLACVFQQNGIKNVQVNGVFPVFSPDDNRYLSQKEEWLRMNYLGIRQQIKNILEHPGLYEKFGITKEELEDGLIILEKRYKYERENCTWIFGNGPQLIISGIK